MHITQIFLSFHFNSHDPLFINPYTSYNAYEFSMTCFRRVFYNIHYIENSVESIHLLSLVLCYHDSLNPSCVFMRNPDFFLKYKIKNSIYCANLDGIAPTYTLINGKMHQHLMAHKIIYTVKLPPYINL